MSGKRLFAPRPPPGTEYSGKSWRLNTQETLLDEQSAELNRNIVDLRTPLEKNKATLAVTSNDTIGTANRLFYELKNTQDYEDYINNHNDPNTRIYVAQFINNYLMSINVPALLTFAWCFSYYLKSVYGRTAAFNATLENLMKDYLETGRLQNNGRKNQFCDQITDVIMANLDKAMIWVDKAYSPSSLPEAYREEWNVKYGLRVAGYGTNDNDWHNSTDGIIEVTGFDGSKYDKFINSCTTREMIAHNRNKALERTRYALTEMVPTRENDDEEEDNGNMPLLTAKNMEDVGMGWNTPSEINRALKQQQEDWNDTNRRANEEDCRNGVCGRLTNFARGVTQRVTSMLNRNKQKISGGSRRRRTRRHKNKKHRTSKRRNKRHRKSRR